MSHVNTHFPVPTVNTQDTHSYFLLTFTHTLYLHTDKAVFVKRRLPKRNRALPSCSKVMRADPSKDDLGLKSSGTYT
jgi:hypothetical protein